LQNEAVSKGRLLFFIAKDCDLCMNFLTMSAKIRAHLALLLTTIIFGLHYTVAKNLMPGHFTPMQLIFLRLLFATLIFWIFQKLFVPEKVDKKDLARLAVLGFIGFATNQALFYEGLNLTSPVDASLIHILNPILVLIMASVIIKEKITGFKLGGILLGSSGALILILFGHAGGFNSSPLLGNILITINMVFYALYLVLLKPLVTKYHTSTILKWVSLFGFLFIIPFSFKSMIALQISEIDTFSWLSLGYIILFCTFLAYLLINFALRHVDASAVSYYTYLQPVLATLTSVSVGMGIITTPKIIAAVLIFTGVFLVNKESREKNGNRQ
jgi:drug/metabolite transporter (DMT)-like permease